MNIYPTIIKSKELSDGSHKIRLAVSHRCQTRYIPTRYIVPNVSNINKKGIVVGLPNASVINRALSEQIQKAYKICDSIENIDILSCSQVVELITCGGLSMPTSVKEAFEQYITNRASKCKEVSLYLYRVAISIFYEYKGEDFPLSAFSPAIISEYGIFLKKKKKYSNVSIRMKMSVLHNVVDFAIKRGYVTYRVNPFIDWKQPPNTIRDIALSLDELKRLKSYVPKSSARKRFVDLFFLSFYMCGMNMADLVKVDFNGDSVRFRREKTINRRVDNNFTEFTIPPEAKIYFDSLQHKDGYLDKKYVRFNISAGGRKVSDDLFNGKPLMLYSARKSFAQLCAELGFQDSLIEYCIGDVNSTKSISFYRKITKSMADEAIRKVFDLLK